MRTLSVSIYVLLFAALACLFCGCATSYDSRGRYHRVQRGETMAIIASGYGISLQDLAEFNNITDINSIYVGQKLYIPPKKSRRPRYKKLPWDMVDKTPRRLRRRQVPRQQKIRFERGIFVWPVKGKVVSKFGMRRGIPHEGIDIAAPAGTPIKAAAAGKVVFVGRMRGYGNVIIIRHNNDYFTAYAHNRVNLVRKGKRVKQGEVIAEVGRTGRTTGSHLHFEIRHRQKPRNPLFFLPER